MIDCQKTGGYLYFIANPQDIDEDKLKKWMLDSYAVGNVIGENLTLKDRILVEEIPSGRDHLTSILEAINVRESNTVAILTVALHHPPGNICRDSLFHRTATLSIN